MLANKNMPNTRADVNSEYSGVIIYGEIAPKLGDLGAPPYLTKAVPKYVSAPAQSRVAPGLLKYGGDHLPAQP